MTRIRSERPEGTELDEEVVHIYRCATVVRGGRRFSFSALVVVGDRKGRVGIGYGKATEVPFAVEKGRKIATRSLSSVVLAGTTIPHRIVGRFESSRVLLLPASRGTGVIAGASVRAVLELAGIRDVLTKSYGSTSPKNLVRATFDGLHNMLDPEQVAKLRGVELAV
jgi:small subunit ribosomal protein S5